MVYLDNAATTPVPQAVAEAVYEALVHGFANPSAQYAPGLAMKKQVEQWRGAVAEAMGGTAEGLYFTSCGTEGDFAAISIACAQNRGRHIVTTAVEHSAVLETCTRLEREQGYAVTRIAPDSNGDISAEAVLSAVGPDTALVSVMLVNNELGNRYPVEEIARGLNTMGSGALLHTDAVQGFLKVPFSAKTLGADLITVSAHKIGGPKGIGALYLGPRVRHPRPWLPGGGQERGLRSGTEATAQIAGFAKAAELRRASFPEDAQRMEALRAYAVEHLRTIPDLVLLGGGARGTGAPHILALALNGWPSQNVVNDLSSQGICISAGSACHRGKPSHVVAALGLPKRTAQSVLRLSFGPDTTAADVDACVDALRRHRAERMPML